MSPHIWYGLLTRQGGVSNYCYSERRFIWLSSFWLTWLEQSFHYAAMKNKNIQRFSAESGEHVSPHFWIKPLLMVSERPLRLEKKDSFVWNRGGLDNCTSYKISTTFFWSFYEPRRTPHWWPISWKSSVTYHVQRNMLVPSSEPQFESVSPDSQHSLTVVMDHKCDKSITDESRCCLQAFPNTCLLPGREKYNKYPKFYHGGFSAAVDRTQTETLSLMDREV